MVDRKTTYYDRLGVAQDAPAEVIRKAYRRRALECHPDKTGGSGHPFVRLQVAYDILKDVTERRIYDEYLKRGAEKSEMRQTPREKGVDPESRRAARRREGAAQPEAQTSEGDKWRREAADERRRQTTSQTAAELEAEEMARREAARCVHKTWIKTELERSSCKYCPNKNRNASRCAGCKTRICWSCREGIEARNRRETRFKLKRQKIHGLWQHATLDKYLLRYTGKPLFELEKRKRSCIHDDDGFDPLMHQSLACDICFAHPSEPRWRRSRHICRKCDRTVCNEHHVNMMNEWRSARNLMESRKKSGAPAPKGDTPDSVWRRIQRWHKRDTCLHSKWESVGDVPLSCSFCSWAQPRTTVYRCAACTSPSCKSCVLHLNHLRAICENRGEMPKSRRTN